MLFFDVASDFLNFIFKERENEAAGTGPVPPPPNFFRNG